jgi:hypothetical protein
MSEEAHDEWSGSVRSEVLTMSFWFADTWDMMIKETTGGRIVRMSMRVEDFFRYAGRDSAA